MEHLYNAGKYEQISKMPASHPKELYIKASACFRLGLFHKAHMIFEDTHVRTQDCWIKILCEIQMIRCQCLPYVEVKARYHLGTKIQQILRVFIDVGLRDMVWFRDIYTYLVVMEDFVSHPESNTFFLREMDRLVMNKL